jgi:hypothetical protein
MILEKEACSLDELKKNIGLYENALVSFSRGFNYI